MVLLAAVQSSNARIKSVLPPGLVAVFVGATNGIGETTLKQFAKYSRQPCVYFVGRSQEAGDRIAVECKSLNPEGKFIFLKADISLIRTVDNVYWDSKAKEKSINLLFMTQGTLVTGVGMSPGPLMVVYSMHRKDCRRPKLTGSRMQRLQKASIWPRPCRLTRAIASLSTFCH